MAERKKSWREIDAQRDGSAHRPAERAGRPARNETATAQYKRQLDAFFNRGEVPAHLRDKLPAGEAGAEGGDAGERQRRLRAVRDATTPKALGSAVDALRAGFGLPEDPEILLRVLEHTDDAALLEAIALIEAHVDSGRTLPRKQSFAQRLRGLENTSFDPRVHRRALALAERLR